MDDSCDDDSCMDDAEWVVTDQDGKTKQLCDDHMKAFAKAEKDAGRTIKGLKPYESDEDEDIDEDEDDGE